MRDEQAASCGDSLLAAANDAYEAIGEEGEAGTDASEAAHPAPFVLLSDTPHPSRWLPLSHRPKAWKPVGSYFGPQLGQALGSVLADGGVVKPDKYVSEWLSRAGAIKGAFVPPLLFELLVERELAVRASGLVGCAADNLFCWGQCSQGRASLDSLFKIRRSIGRANFDWSDDFFNGTNGTSPASVHRKRHRHTPKAHSKADKSQHTRGASFREGSPSSSSPPTLPTQSDATPAGTTSKHSPRHAGKKAHGHAAGKDGGQGGGGSFISKLLGRRI